MTQIVNRSAPPSPSIPATYGFGVNSQYTLAERTRPATTNCINFIMFDDTVK